MWYGELYLVCFSGFSLVVGMENPPPKKVQTFLSFKKQKNWKIAVAGSFFLIFEEFLKFTPFLQNYQVFKCKSENLCNESVQNFEILSVRSYDHPPKSPPTPSSPADRRTLKIQLAPTP